MRVQLWLTRIHSDLQSLPTARRRRFARTRKLQRRQWSKPLPSPPHNASIPANPSQKWGQAHSRVSPVPAPATHPPSQLTTTQAHFAILKTLLASGTLAIAHSPSTQTLTVHVDRTKILTHGKPALGQMLLRLHIYRCTADVAACREYYEGLTKVEEEDLRWRETVLARKPPPLVFVQANTFLDEEGDVRLKEYEESVEGVVQSWAERGL